MTDLHASGAHAPVPDSFVLVPEEPRRRRRLLPVGAAVVALALAGGGYAATSGGSAPTTAGVQMSPAASITRLVHAAPAKAAAAKSSRMSMSIDTTATGMSFTMTADGAFDYANGTAQMTMTMPMVGQMAMVMTGDTMYVRMPDKLAGQVPGGKPWVKVDLAALGDKMGVNLKSLLDQAKQQDPLQSLKVLTHADGVQKVGTEDVRGVPTTHYAGQVSLDQLMAAMPSQLADQLRAQAEKVGMKSVGIDVWIDKDGLPRRLTEDMILGDTMTMHMSMDLYDWGQDVQVTPPPADQVTDLSALMAHSA